MNVDVINRLTYQKESIEESQSAGNELKLVKLINSALVQNVYILQVHH